ncbi:MAG: FecR domain-containing protein, partial [Oscillospiraceae bacterium]|nr:FecR domain-containing protein [Oscillospiraceae bacterium]
MMKRILSLVMTILLFAGMAFPASAAAEEAIGTTIRLAQLDGTITVKNASGKTVDAREDMRIYNGYTVETGKKSTVYITLDDEKAVKLDTRSKVTLKKNGKKIEVSLVSGTLLFSVETPLKPNESLNISTSTMVTGVRGSFGWVSGLDVGMLHGHAEMTCRNRETGETVQTELNSGECISYNRNSDMYSFAQTVWASSVQNDQDPTSENNTALEKNGFSITPITEDNANPLALDEMLHNEKWQQTLQQDTNTRMNYTSLSAKAPGIIAQSNENKEQTESDAQANLTSQNNEIQGEENQDKKNGVDNNVSFDQNANSNGNGQQGQQQSDTSNDLIDKNELYGNKDPEPTSGGGITPTPTPTPTPTEPASTADL